MTMGALYHKL